MAGNISSNIIINNNNNNNNSHSFSMRSMSQSHAHHRASERRNQLGPARQVYGS